MEGVFAPSDHRSISAYGKQIKSPSKRNISNSRRLVPITTEKLTSSNNNSSSIHGGFFFAPPPPPHALSSSFPPSSSYLMLYPNQQQNHHQMQSRRQPPLLPLPVSSKSYNSRAGDLASPPPSSTSTRKPNRNKDQYFLTTKRSKQPATVKKDHPKQDSKSMIISSTVLLGRDPTNLPKDASKFLSASPPSSTGNGVIVNINSTPAVEEHLERFTGSVYTISPPPSSLPLPKFSVRPKILSCTAEAAGIDAGATDNLRRILRLL